MTNESNADVIPVSVLTGFLGAGKTTLLNALLADPAMAGTAVIINEFGEVGIDHLLVETATDSFIEMSSGCLCCTIRGDLVDALVRLLEKRDAGEIMRFDRIVIETTGLADPAPVIHVLMADQRLLRRLRLDGVITVVDAVNAAATLDAHFEAVKQVAVADRLVVAKTDLADAAAVLELKQRLATLNPTAPILDAARGEARPPQLFNAGLYDPTTKQADVVKWLSAEAYAAPHDHHHHHDVNRHDESIRAYCLTTEAPIGGTSFSLFLELLNAQYGRDLLRMKGIVKLAEEPDHPLVVHAVQNLFHPPVRLEAWPDDDHRTRLVFITRNVSREKVESLLSAFTDPLTGGGASFADETLSLHRPGGLLS